MGMAFCCLCVLCTALHRNILSCKLNAFLYAAHLIINQFSFEFSHFNLYLEHNIMDLCSQLCLASWPVRQTGGWTGGWPAGHLA